MSKNKINIEIGAKNKTGGAFSGVMGGLKRLAGAAAAYFSARAVIGFVKSSIDAFMKQESALQSLSSALKKNGDNVSALMPRYQKFASAIQSITTEGDESTLELMAYGRNLGISADQLEDATKAAIGFSRSLGIDVRTAMMMIARSSKGQNQLWSRYGFVIKDSMKKQDAFNFILKEGSKGLKLAADEANTLKGRLAQATNAYGDMKENIGAAVVEGFNLTQVFDDLALNIQAANDAGNFKAWAEDIAALKQGLEPVAKLFGNIRDSLKAVSSAAGETWEIMAEERAAIKRGDFKAAFGGTGEKFKRIGQAAETGLYESENRRIAREVAVEQLRTQRDATLQEMTGGATLDDVVKAVDGLKTK
jgi:hypothetical protein